VGVIEGPDPEGTSTEYQAEDPDGIVFRMGYDDWRKIVRLQQGLTWFGQVQRSWLLTAPHSASDDLTCALRQVARAMGLLASIPFVLFFLYASTEVWPELAYGSVRGIPLLLALAMAAVSVLIAWHSELVGGVLTVACAIAVVALIRHGSRYSLFALVLLNMLPYSLAGIVLLTCDRESRRSRFWQAIGVAVLVYLGSGHALLLLAVLNTAVYCLVGVLFVVCHLRSHHHIARQQNRTQPQSAAMERRLSKLY
jgi:hypothetical protein